MASCGVSAAAAGDARTHKWLRWIRCAMWSEVTSGSGQINLAVGGPISMEQNLARQRCLEEASNSSASVRDVALGPRHEMTLLTGVAGRVWSGSVQLRLKPACLGHKEREIKCQADPP